jgi:hypothetical protein
VFHVHMFLPLLDRVVSACGRRFPLANPTSCTMGFKSAKWTSCYSWGVVGPDFTR